MVNNIEGRNPVRINDYTIDIEINHPSFGWIMFTASGNDIEEHGRLIFNDCINGVYGEITEPLNE